MASNLLPPPDKLNCKGGDLATEWKQFRSAFMDFLVATKRTDEPKAVQVATLKTVIGRDARMILENLTIANDPALKTVLDALEEYFEPRENVI